MATEALLLL